MEESQDQPQKIVFKKKGKRNLRQRRNSAEDPEADEDNML